MIQLQFPGRESNFTTTKQKSIQWKINEIFGLPSRFDLVYQRINKSNDKQ
jgi:hypothetical protein